MNKKSGLILTAIIFSIFLINFVSANQIIDQGKKLSKDIFNEIIKPIAELLFKNSDALTGELLFAKVLFFIIIISIIWKTLEQVEFFSEHSGVHWLIAISASILATRWLSSAELIKTILLPYTTLGIAISAGIPFVLWFIIINRGFKGPGHKTIRRIAWIFFAVILAGLWISRQPELSTGNSKAYLIYPITAVLAFLMAWMDGTIQKFFLRLELDKVGVSTKQKLIDNLKKDLANLPGLANEIGLSNAEQKRRKKDIEKELKRLTK